MHPHRRVRALGAAVALAAAALAVPGPAGAAITCGGPSEVRTVDLWARTGTTSLPGIVDPVPIWAFSATNVAPTAAGGPVLEACAGDALRIVLHNGLPAAAGPLSLSIPQGILPPDVSGVDTGDSKIYRLPLSHPGTLLYEAGPTAEQARLIALGLYGAIVVRPNAAPLQSAYGAGTEFDEESVLVLSEIDHRLNMAANPLSYDMSRFRARFRLINGRAYPDTAELPAGGTLPGHRVLLRYVNAGVDDHTMGALGARQLVIAADGYPLPYQADATVELVPPGGTRDTILGVPDGTPGATRLPLLDQGLRTDNNGGFAPSTQMLAPGGMLTFVTVANTAQTCVGPTPSGVSVTVDGGTGVASASSVVTVAAAFTPCDPGSPTITGQEYSVDAQVPPGAGTPLGTPVNLSTLGTGVHTVYVRGEDATGWGPVTSAAFRLDTLGPRVAPETIQVVPNPTPGAAGAVLQISATADETLSGGQDVAAATFTLDGGPTPVAMTPNVIGLISHLTGSLTIGGSPLAEGAHTISVTAVDSAGNVGAAASSTFVVDRTGPAATALVLDPPATNGTTGAAGDTGNVLLHATLVDAASAIARGEGAVGTPGAPGTGNAVVAADGTFDSPSEEVVLRVPLAEFQSLPDGTVQVWIRGRDAAGAWGAPATATLVLDRTAPVASAAAVAPATVQRLSVASRAVALTATGTDGASAIAEAEWFEGADPGVGAAARMAAVDGAFDELDEAVRATVDARFWAAGAHQIRVRVRDAAGTWSPATTVTLTVTP